MLARWTSPLGLLSLLIVSATAQSTFDWTLRSRQDLAMRSASAEWEASRTAFIVCDMWDYHHSVNAVRRLKQFAPRLDAVLAEARQRGATIIHAPSDCMPFYTEHAARKRALAVPTAADLPEDVAAWCHRIPEEERATYPIDQSNGGEDDDLQEHAQWAAYLKSIDRNPGTPWKRQTDLLTIDAEQDFIAAEGDRVWNILESKQLSHVVLVGVHTNMCVLGRPFGLRQMKRLGKTVTLMRDMTDVMYEPNSWPYVSHFSGIDLVIEHIERHVCPTVTSDQVLGGQAFRFAEDRRPTVAVALPPKVDDVTRAFFQQDLRRAFHVHLLDEHSPKSALLETNALWFHAGNQVPHEAIDAFAATGRPIVGTIDSPETPDHQKTKGEWFGISAFDTAYFGRNPLTCPIDSSTHPSLTNLPNSIEVGETITGNFNQRIEPIITHAKSGHLAWTFVREDSGLSIALPAPRKDGTRMLALNALCWATQQPFLPGTPNPESAWRTLEHKIIPTHSDISWIRTLVKGEAVTSFRMDHLPDAQVFLNAQPLVAPTKGDQYLIPADSWHKDALNVLAIRLPANKRVNAGFVLPNDSTHWLKGRWQHRQGDDQQSMQFPIPPQFGAATDYIQELP